MKKKRKRLERLYSGYVQSAFTGLLATSGKDPSVSRLSEEAHMIALQLLRDHETGFHQALVELEEHGHHKPESVND